MKKWILSLAFLAISNTVFAGGGKVLFTVIDPGTGEPLRDASGAVVSALLPELKDGQGVGFDPNALFEGREPFTAPIPVNKEGHPKVWPEEWQKEVEDPEAFLNGKGGSVFNLKFD